MSSSFTPCAFTVPVDRSTRQPAAKTLRCLLRYDRLVLTAHRGPDGDGLGSLLALAELLRAHGKRVQIAADGGVPHRLAFLPGAARIVGRRELRWTNFDALVVLDSGSFDRIGWVGDRLPAGVAVVNIDHHSSNTRFGAHHWVEPSLGSVGEMIYRLARASETGITRSMAVALYVAMVSDNGSFSYSNTAPYSHLIAADLLRCGVQPDWVSDRLHNSRTHGELALQAEAIRRMRASRDGRIAWTVFPRALYRKLRATPEESQEYVSLLRSVRGVALAILIRETEEAGKVKVSLRSDRSANCNLLARHFGGGGHARAAGCTLAGPLPAAVRRVVRAALSLYTR